MPGDVGQPADTVAQRARACDAQGDARSDELEPLACISTRLSGGQHSVGTRLCAKRQPQRVASGLRLVFDPAALQSGRRDKLGRRRSFCGLAVTLSPIGWEFISYVLQSLPQSGRDLRAAGVRLMPQIRQLDHGRVRLSRRQSLVLLRRLHLWRLHLASHLGIEAAGPHSANRPPDRHRAPGHRLLRHRRARGDLRGGLRRNDLPARLHGNGF